MRLRVACLVLTCLWAGTVGLNSASAMSPASAATIAKSVSQRRATRIAVNRVRPMAKQPSSATSGSTRIASAGSRPTVRELRERALQIAERLRRRLPRPTDGIRRPAAPDEEDDEENKEDDVQSGTPLPVRTPEPPLKEYQAVLAELFTLVNEERAKHNLPAFERNGFLDIAAQNYAQELYDRNFFDHVSPDGVTFSERIKAAGYPGVSCPQPGCSIRVSMGENLAKGFTAPKDVLAGWMKSSGHRANILSETFTEMGLGIVGALWTQEFGDVTIRD